MKKTNIEPSLIPVLNEQICQQLGEKVLPVELSAHKKETMRSRILDRIVAQQPEEDLISTIRKNEGSWITIAPKLHKKRLFIDAAKNLETFLLKADPGAEIPAHVHKHDEFSMILEGSVHFEHMQLHVGDYHIARKGSYHGNVTCPDGALIYLQADLDEYVND